jgi:serine protease Do
VEAKYEGKNTPVEIQNGPDDDSGPQQLPPGMPDIFRRFFGTPMMPPQNLGHTSLGSGFIISSDGYILTNNHVVDHADEVTVRLQDRRTLTAKVVGTDETYDIALLKVDASGLPAVTLGDSRTLKPGQWVLAIGSPFGFDYTVTQGIVSAVGRNLGSQDQPYTSFIQTDVPINRGNSGGPLFNLQGQVVGINSQIYSNTGSYAGVSFSIPIDLVMDAVQQIKTKGYVARGMIGVRIQTVDADAAKAMGMSRASGALVADVTPGSPAAKAGIQVQDVIVGFNGHDVETSSDLPPLVASTAPGTEAALKILRNGKSMTLNVKVGEMPRGKNALTAMTKGASAGADVLGLDVKDIDADQRDSLDLKPGEGVLVTRVTGRQAMRAGISAGDVILRVGRTAVGSVAAYRDAINGIKPGDTVMLLVHNDQGTGFVTITVPRDK